MILDVNQMSRVLISKTRNGILINHRNKSILLDPDGNQSTPYKPDIILISHAHFDHVKGLKYVYSKGIKIVLSRETYTILSSLGYKFYPEDLVFVKPGDTLDLGGIKLSIYNAGHVLGSCMFSIELPRVTISYTGDFNFEDTIIMRKADLMDADVLLIDATYGHPLFSFPPREILYKLIRENLKEIVELGNIPILHGYALGKGQELTRIAYDFVGGIISVTKSVARFNRIYEEFNKISLGNYIIGAHGDVLIKEFGRMRWTRSDKYRKLIFSGWTIKYGKEGFPLSSHSSFTKIIEYIDRIEPDFIIPLYSNASFLTRLIEKEFGIKTDIFNHNQKEKDIIYNISLRGIS